MTLEEVFTSRDEINAAAAHRPRRGDQQVGHPHQPRRDQVDRPAGLDPGGDGEADAGRARPPRRHPQRPRASSSRRSSPQRARSSPRSCAPRAPRRQRSCAPRVRRRRSTRCLRRSTPASRIRAAQLPVPADAAAPGRRGGQQALDHPERVLVGARRRSMGQAIESRRAPRSRELARARQCARIAATPPRAPARPGSRSGSGECG